MVLTRSAAAAAAAKAKKSKNPTDDTSEETPEAQTSSSEETPMDPATRKLLECPVCLDLPWGNVFQCVQGHHICQRCFDNLRVQAPYRNRRCPVAKCAFPHTPIRNRIVEQMIAASEVQIPCPYALYGCKTPPSKASVIQDHAERCSFKEIECFGGDDCGKVARGLFATHYSEAHGDLILSTKSCRFTLSQLDFHYRRRNQDYPRHLHASEFKLPCHQMTASVPGCHDPVTFYCFATINLPSCFFSVRADMKHLRGVWYRVRVVLPNGGRLQYEGVPHDLEETFNDEMMYQKPAGLVLPSRCIIQDEGAPASDKSLLVEFDLFKE